MLDLAFLKFVGSGLTSFAPAYNIQAPEGAIENGHLFLDELWKADPIGARDIVEKTTTKLWSEWKFAGLPVTIAQQHLKWLPTAMEGGRADPDKVLAALAVAQASMKLGGKRLDVQARALATDIIGSCSKSGTLTRCGLNEQITFFFLETLYTELLTCKRTVDRHQALLETFCQQKPWRSAPISQPQPSEPEATDHELSATPHNTGDDAGDANPELQKTTSRPPRTGRKLPPPLPPTRTHPAQQDDDSAGETAKPIEAQTTEAAPELDTVTGGVEVPAAATSPTPAALPAPPAAEMMPDSGIVAAIATETGCSVATVATIEHSLKRRYGPKRAKPDQVRAAARHCRMLLDDLSANLPPASPAAGRLVEAHGLLHAGKPSEAEAALAQAEDLEIEAAKSADQAAALSATMSAAEIRKWRGQLQEILGDFRRAARHYMLANRHIPRDDYANRWRYTGRQVRSLIESAERFADVGAYAEASKICAEAIAVLPQKLADRPRNEARMQLAEILVCQANADGGVAALETATEHLRHACAYFSEHGPAERAGEAYTRRASALSQIAERSGNANALEAAVDSYIDLTASFSSEAADFDWQRINASLRRALESVGRHAAESNPGLAMQLRTKLDGLEKVAQAAPSGTAQKAEQLLPTGSD